MNTPALHAAMSSRLFNRLVTLPSPNAQSAKVWFKRFIQMSESFSRALVFTKQIPEIQSVHQLQLRLQNQPHLQLRQPQLQKMINRDVADDRLQSPNHALNHRLRADQSHLASLSAKFSDRS